MDPIDEAKEPEVEVKKRRGRPPKDSAQATSEEGSSKTIRGAKSSKTESRRDDETTDASEVCDGPRKSSRNKGEPAKKYMELDLTPEVTKRKKKVESKVKADEYQSEKSNKAHKSDSKIANDVEVNEKKKRGKKRGDDTDDESEDETEEPPEPRVATKKRVGAKKKVVNTPPMEEEENPSPPKRRKQQPESPQAEEVESPVKSKRGRKKKDQVEVNNEPQIAHQVSFFSSFHKLSILELSALLVFLFLVLKYLLLLHRRLKSKRKNLDERKLLWCRSKKMMMKKMKSRILRLNNGVKEMVPHPNRLPPPIHLLDLRSQRVEN